MNRLPSDELENLKETWNTIRAETRKHLLWQRLCSGRKVVIQLTSNRRRLQIARAMERQRAKNCDTKIG